MRPADRGGAEEAGCRAGFRRAGRQVQQHRLRAVGEPEARRRAGEDRAPAKRLDRRAARAEDPRPEQSPAAAGGVLGGRAQEQAQHGSRRSRARHARRGARDRAQARDGPAVRGGARRRSRRSSCCGRPPGSPRRKERRKLELLKQGKDASARVGARRSSSAARSRRGCPSRWCGRRSGSTPRSCRPTPGSRIPEGGYTILKVTRVVDAQDVAPRPARGVRRGRCAARAGRRS